MTNPALIFETRTPDHSESKPAHQYMAVWTLVGVLILIACAALVLDSSIAQEQRFTIFLQSGMFP
jgi:hypothetical protein